VSISLGSLFWLMLFGALAVLLMWVGLFAPDSTVDKMRRPALIQMPTASLRIAYFLIGLGLFIVLMYVLGIR
jgi:predicted membrane metal-binding protein